MSRVLMLTCLVLAAATACTAAPAIEATRIQGRVPIIDGDVASDPAWAAAPVVEGFTLLGKADSPATQATQVRVLFNNQRLYVGFVCQEDQVDKLVAAVTNNDGPVYLDDCVELFLSPYADRSRYYHFVVNSAGALRDELVQDEKWNSGARAAAKVGEGSWSVEIAINFAALKLDETTGSEWGINFCRAEKPTGELSCWAPCASGFHEPKSFGTASGLDANFAPLMVAGIRSRAAVASNAIRELQKSAEQYAQLQQGSSLIGACARDLEELRAIQRALGRRLGVVQVRGEGSKVAAIETGIPELQSRLNKLPMIEMGGRRGYAVCAESTMVKVQPDKPYNGIPTENLRMSLARNEYEATQVVVVPLRDSLKKVEVSVTDLKGPRKSVIPADSIDVNVVGYVNVKRPTGRSPLGPGLYPDPLLDNQPTDVDQAHVQSWWITVHAPEDQRAGFYRGKVIINPQNAKQTELLFTVRVWDFKLPTASRLRGSYGINLSSVLSKYDVAAGPGQPNEWTAGAWTGADMNGVENYFGSMDYNIDFDYDEKKSGERSIHVRVADLQKGVQEVPRFCWYTGELDLKPDTDYEFSVWYRTAPGTERGPAGYFASAGEVRWEPTEGEWKLGTYEFNTGDKKGIRVYLKVDAKGSFWFDKGRLAVKTDQPTPNVLPNPDFEKGDETARERIMDAYFLNALKHRASPTSLIAPKITTNEDGSVAIDWTEFDEKMQLYVDHGLNAFNVFWCELPSGWGTVENVQDEKRITRARQLLEHTQAHLDQKNWTQLAYIYTIDEPGWQAFPQVKQAFDLAHASAPALKTLLTYGYGASKPIEPGAPRYADLAGYVDIHVPHSDCYEPIFLRKRQEIGDEIWAYVCISAQRPYLNNWTIDAPGMDHRLLFWQLFDYDITGFLYWQITYWQVNPWEDTLTYPGGNGDGSLIYPGPDGPVNSIRFELNRDGTEDYDMMVLLRDAVTALNARGRNLSTDPYLDFPQLTKSWTEYSENPELLERQRELIGNRLETLTRMVER